MNKNQKSIELIPELTNELYGSLEDLKKIAQDNDELKTAPAGTNLNNEDYSGSTFDEAFPNYYNNAQKPFNTMPAHPSFDAGGKNKNQAWQDSQDLDLKKIFVGENKKEINDPHPSLDSLDNLNSASWQEPENFFSYLASWHKFLPAGINSSKPLGDLGDITLNEIANKISDNFEKLNVVIQNATGGVVSMPTPVNTLNLMIIILLYHYIFKILETHLKTDYSLTNKELVTAGTNYIFKHKLQLKNSIRMFRFVGAPL